MLKPTRGANPMEACSIPRTSPLPPLISSIPTKHFLPFSLPKSKPHQSSTSLSHFTLSATPRGFGYGTSQKKPKRSKKKPRKGSFEDDDEDKEEEVEEDEEEGVIPEIVTNRMMSRMGLSVGIPLFIGLLFFPFFYYLKVGLKIDVPTWIPFIVSFIFFGTALLGVSYGIVSSSWDPMREGSLLGWNEAQKNWPVFWQSIWGGSKKN
ncbi:PREDICTED: protein PAM68, chloroplastic [Ipomoea nil]|uniref:protein PAM68, chloroplastic n=1 Tax=Ipomoea nil TaxID=35883 RepID=UPI0009013C14|nr:PREDICTED: protein PAM68, chloroplastic [Ipomoea nil]